MIKIELEKLLAGRSLNWLSVETGIRWPTLRAMTQGKARRFELSALDKLCDALQCEPGDLLVKAPRKKVKR